ncbi:hypothetical protein ACFO4N_03640 [Camelliibacillus cellulosilyticus]|uniref:Uncharacterized protein n=1 Tax=Camelliibacillus cellulosilyticus TaxID=2174486 RepID=A0ABV9GIU3_9BACL
MAFSGIRYSEYTKQSYEGLSRMEGFSHLPEERSVFLSVFFYLLKTDEVISTRVFGYPV